ncbi:MAG: helix-turn-helix domain-containing protein [Methylomicrobium sp.]|uniref:helix-turn-helix transcriptional regulator n=1 Tax=Methylotuvimicrobium sp. TaxID=2822413 RepID=UPI00114FC9C6|nr:helix-turn-helix domain-containing protein [Methylomicrobium sp.]MBU2570480.1 helix-turn-helix domain-containing protein [Gammaproteobacteria bacterium]
MTDSFLTAAELMQTLKVNSKTTFWRMRKRGDVPEPTIKSPLRWRKSEFESYYQERQKATK